MIADSFQTVVLLPLSISNNEACVDQGLDGADSAELCTNIMDQALQRQQNTGAYFPLSLGFIWFAIQETQYTRSNEGFEYHRIS